MSKIFPQAKILKNHKAIFFEQRSSTNNIMLVENSKQIREDEKLAHIMNEKLE